MPDLPNNPITFLFTDIEGSTKLWEQHPEAMQHALACHDAILRQAIEAHSGHIFKTIGDAFCAAFTEAPDALAAAIAAQRALHAESWTGTGPLRVRMVLHSGKAETRDNDYFGSTINRVARLLAAGHGGQVLLSLTAGQLVQGALPEGVSLSNLGSHRLKDLQWPEYVLQLRHPELPHDFPSLRSLEAFAHNLPQQLTSFIGREKEMAEVKRLLTVSRLLTLTGVGGAGKTRLALQVAAESVDDYPDGVWLVELAALSDPALVPTAAASALGLREEANQTLMETLADHLKPKRLLLALDNCEHQLAASATLADTLLKTCPNLHILATSREALDFAGERTYRVPTLSLPNTNRFSFIASSDPSCLLEYEAMRLFVERASVSQPGFALTVENAAAVAQVCRRLDGIPLAIELAAARVKVLSVEQIAQRLDDRFRLLTGGSRTALPRQQTLRASMDWSYDLLSEPERIFLRRLSVFAGGWTLPAAEAVCPGVTDGKSKCGFATIEDEEVLNVLSRLVDKSLVLVEEHGAELRYRLLETIRQYGWEQLMASGEGEVIRIQHGNYFLDFAEQSEPHLYQTEQGEWLERIEREHDNLRAALDWAATNADRSEILLRLAGSLWRFWQVRGHWSEGREWLRRALDATGSAPPSPQRERALTGSGNLAMHQDDYAIAQLLFEQSLSVAQALNDEKGVAGALGNLGRVAYAYGDYATACRLIEESVALQRKLGNAPGLAASTSNLALVVTEQGDISRARALQEESLATEETLGNQRGVAISLKDLGFLARSEGDYVRARAYYERSLTIERDLGAKSGIAETLRQLGALALDQGDYAAAHARYREALTLEQVLGDKRTIAGLLEGFAALAASEGRAERAARLMGAAEALRAVIKAPPSPSERADNDRRIAPAALGDAAFAVALTQGRAMTLEQAVAFALEGGDD